MSDQTSRNSAWVPSPGQAAAESAVIGAMVLAACLFGIQTRVLFSLASLWPANALLLGILLLRPGTNTPLTWLAASTAFLVGDLATGSSPLNAVVLNGTNLAGVVFGLVAWRLLFKPTASLSRPIDAILSVTVISAAALGAAIAGALIGPWLFGMDWITSLGLWFAGEFVNYAIFLPVALATLSPDTERFRFASRNPMHRRHQLAAVCSLLLSIAVVHWIGGPSAATYLVPSLVWCAVCFRPFACAVLAMLASTWMLVAGPLGQIPLQIDMEVANNASSFRLGVGMVAVGTFAVSLINSAWRNAHAAMSHQASHDALTGLMNRGAFVRKLDGRLRRAERGQFSLLMIDVDRFKTINDTYGHPAGDAVLQALAEMLRKTAGQHDLVARIGGEEFAVLVEGPSQLNGVVTAELILAKTRRLSIHVAPNERIEVTVSIGVAECRNVDDISSLLSASDSALYVAKHGGRDRLVTMAAAPFHPQAAPFSP